jgi:hypothetical protein
MVGLGLSLTPPTQVDKDDSGSFQSTTRPFARRILPAVPRLGIVTKLSRDGAHTVSSQAVLGHIGDDAKQGFIERAERFRALPWV